MSRVFFVFSFAKKAIRAGTGLIGWRDKYSMDTERGAKKRRQDLKKDPPREQVGKVSRRVIRTEVW